MNAPTSQETKPGGTTEKSFGVAAPSLSLPKGGGAIKGIGEKFAANPVTGTGSMTIPIAVSPGRSGFGPRPALAYDSGAGNGAFGIGWDVSLPAITRRTEKGLPQYRDAEESDVFILSGAEDLVPVLVPNGAGWAREQLPICVVGGVNFRIDRYRPRIEGLFARIERWSNLDDRSDVRWRSISKENVTTWYGADAASRIADPANPSHIFSWRICQTHDDKGNVSIYEYVSEDAQGIDTTEAHECNRSELARGTNRYVRRIRYGNRTPYFPEYKSTLPLTPLPGDGDWMFSVVFDYDEGRYQPESLPGADPALVRVAFNPKAPQSGWPVRSDPFSSYRSGFEVRSYRLCRRVLMFHHFPAKLHTADCLVRSTELNYQETEAGSFVTAVVQSGYVRVAGSDPAHPGDLYRKRSLPPLEFEYTQLKISSEIRDVDPSSLENLPVGLDGNAYQWVDLDGEGLTGILAEQNGAWYYKRNLSALPRPSATGVLETRASFAPVECVAQLPASAFGGRHQFLDLAGDGSVDLVNFNGATPGFYERTPEGSWTPFTAFRSRPNMVSNDSSQHFIDLTGDGRADILITEDSVFTYHASLGEEGFDEAKQVFQTLDEAPGPRLLTADATVLIGVADMSGDGLADLVRIGNGEVCYWPNLGYGRFGAKITLENSPRFDLPDQFDPKRLRLADIDGSGTTDLVYLGRERVVIHRNLCGNRLADAEPLAAFPPVDDHTAVQVCDLLGNGTACLVWSSPLSGDQQRSMRYVDLMGGQKPHLLVKVRNNLGAEVTVQYAPSTKFYLADQAAGKPWITKLPFPVHCVEKTTVTDKWRHTKFSSTYSYHHGYFDGVEREFRGFGRVEQVDVEDYGMSAAGNSDSPYVTQDQTLYQPPIKTVTWYHTGAALERERILTQFQQEYFPHSLAALPSPVAIDSIFQEKPLPEPDLETLNLSSDEWREALRACKGMVLRQEVYELEVDALRPVTAKPARQIPVRLFSAATHNCRIRCLQPMGGNPHAVFLVSESEALTYHYELDLRPSPPPAGSTTVPPLAPDPRIAHTLNLSFDDYGNIQQAVAIGYPRQRMFADPALPAHVALIREVQREQHIAYTETHYTDDAIDAAGGTAPVKFHRLRMPCEMQAFELTGFTPAAGIYFDLADLRSCALSTSYLPTAPSRPVTRKRYHELPQTTALTMRLVEHARTLFLKNDLSGPLGLGELASLGLPYEQYKLALTKSLLDAIFTDGQLEKNIPAGGSVRDALNNWKTSGYLSDADATAIFGVPATEEYWMRSGIAGFEPDADQHFYLPEKYTDAFDRTTTLQYDPFDLFVQSSQDPMGNTSSVEQFDYRVLAPAELKDASGNISRVAFDILGLPVATAVMGKSGTESGDNLSGLALDPPVVEVQNFLTAAYDASVPTNWLGAASARFVYDLGFSVTAAGTITYCSRPPCAFGVVRETHVNAGGSPKIQATVEYTDGLGAVLVKKAQAEPDPKSALANPPLRWIASGKTILNNKGKPVKQYEPYFSRFEHRFDLTETETEVGVTPLMYYDAAGRLVRTELPDGTLSRVEFSPWFVSSFDANDTVLESAWYQTRNLLSPAAALTRDVNGTISATPEQRAGWLTARHAKTPAQTHLDSLGRDVVAIVHNRVEDPAGTLQYDGRMWRDDFYLTFTKLDAEGKPLWIRDARGNLVMQYLWPQKPDRDEPRVVRDFSPAGNPNNDIGARVPCYDIAGNLLFQHSMDAGNRWMINDAAGKPMAAWDFNQREDAAGSSDETRLYFTEYDALHRPTALWLTVWDRPTPAPGATALPYVERAGEMVERFEYQDAVAPDTDNLNGQPIRHYDPSGLTEMVRRDFKGNALETRRRLNNQPSVSRIDWQGAAATLAAKLEGETFRQITEYDALNRIVLHYNWHRETVGSPVAKYTLRYSERGVLVSEDLTVRLEKGVTSIDPGPNTQTTTAIEEIRYDVKGQKEFLQLGNGTLTQYDYDPTTFRLKQVRTTRPSDASDFPARRSNLADIHIVQQLLYTHDPVGNITEVEDQAFEPVFFDQGVAEPKSQYEYDALYRLVWASGRETAQGGDASLNGGEPELSNAFPVTDQTLRRYIQRYEYDATGNFLRMQHVVPTDSASSWTRQYTPASDSNRLLRTWTGTKTWDLTPVAKRTEYRYDTHGSMRNVARAAGEYNVRWDHRDMIGSIALGNDTTARYQYDSGKQRTRKIVERDPVDVLSHTIKEERISLSGYELYRRYTGDPTDPVEEIESHHLVDGKQRVLLVEDVLRTKSPRPDNRAVTAQTLFRYQYGNHLGSAGLELDDQAAIISYEEYHPYGTSAYRALDSAIEAPPKRYRYTGMERDEESGLNYHEARYYSPWLGRWLSCDPEGSRVTLRLYEYCGDQPIRFLDPNGRALTEEEKKTMDGLVAWQKENKPASDEISAVLTEQKAAMASGDQARADALEVKANAVVRGQQHKEQTSFLKDFGKTLLGTTAGVIVGMVGWEAGLVVAGALELSALTTTVFAGLTSGSTVVTFDAAKRGVMGERQATREETAATLLISMAVPAAVHGAAKLDASLGAIPKQGPMTLAELDLAAAKIAAAPGQRIFYAGATRTTPLDPNAPVADVVAARTNGNQVTFDTATSAKYVKIVLENAQRANPGSHVYIGSGSHGDLLGGSAMLDSTLAEPVFFAEDVALIAPGTFPGLGPKHVSNIATPGGAATFSAAEQTASTLAPGSMTSVRAWCFSTISVDPH